MCSPRGRRHTERSTAGAKSSVSHVAHRGVRIPPTRRSMRFLHFGRNDSSIPHYGVLCHVERSEAKSKHLILRTNRSPSPHRTTQHPQSNTSSAPQHSVAVKTSRFHAFFHIFVTSSKYPFDKFATMPKMFENQQTACNCCVNLLE